MAIQTTKPRRSKGRPRPMLGTYFTLDTTHRLEEARAKSREAALKMRRNRVRSRNGQIKALTAELRKKR